MRAQYYFIGRKSLSEDFLNHWIGKQGRKYHRSVSVPPLSCSCVKNSGKTYSERGLFSTGRNFPLNSQSDFYALTVFLLKRFPSREKEEEFNPSCKAYFDRGCPSCTFCNTRTGRRKRGIRMREGKEWLASFFMRTHELSPELSLSLSLSFSLYLSLSFLSPLTVCFSIPPTSINIITSLDLLKNASAICEE